MMPAKSWYSSRPSSRIACLAILARALQLLVLVGEELIGEPQDARLLLARHAEDGGEDAQRVRRGDVAREVAFALARPARERVDELAGARLHGGVDAVHARAA